MQCSEFEAIVHDLNRAGVLDLAAREAAVEHAQTCAACAALREAADSLTAELYTLAMAEQQHEAPPRVEAAVVAAFRANLGRAHGVRHAPAWAWSLAAAALLILGLGTWILRSSRRNESAPQVAGNSYPAARVPQTTQQPERSPQKNTATEQTRGQTQQADSFLPLPYSEPLAVGEDAAIVRVRMPRGALGVFGLPVNEERANEMIQVEFLLAEDGSPQAVRLSR